MKKLILGAILVALMMVAPAPRSVSAHVGAEMASCTMLTCIAQAEWDCIHNGVVKTDQCDPADEGCDWW